MKNKSALIIVDAQYDFMPGGSLAVKGGDEIIPVINKLISKFDWVIFTQDWHPTNHKSFASQHEGKNPFDMINLNGFDQVLWPDHCVQNSMGARIHEDIISNPELKNKKVYIFKKGNDPEVDSYSGFFDNGRVNSTGLDEFLKENEVDTLYVTGLATDFCVYYTCKDAISLGYKTFVVLDATRVINENWPLENFGEASLIDSLSIKI